MGFVCWLGSRAHCAAAIVGALLLLLGSSPAMAQFRIEFQPQRRPSVEVQQPRRPVFDVQPQRRPVVVTPRSPSYVFGARRHTDELAVQLVRQANAVCLEMYYNYRHNPDFRETYREMYQVLQDAKHIHELVHDQYHHARRQGDDHIARDLLEMDGLTHHIEEDIARWTPGTSVHDHHHGHVHGSARVHGQNLHRLMQSFADTLHHLMSDYGVKSQIGIGGEAPPPEDGFTAPPPASIPSPTGRP